MSAQCDLLPVQSTVEDSKNVTFGLLFRSLGGIEVGFILALFASGIERYTLESFPLVSNVQTGGLLGLLARHNFKWLEL